MNEDVAALLENFKSGHPRFAGMRDDGAFSAMCMMYLFYANPLIPFADDVCERYVVDGVNDGGIDAIFRNPDPDAEEVVIVQSKYYCENNPVTPRLLKSELDKIARTLKSFHGGGSFHGSARMRRAYLDAHDDFDAADACYHVVFCTSWIPGGADARRKLVNICREYSRSRYFVEIKFGDDLVDEASGYGQNAEFVKTGELKLFGRKSVLRYLESAVVNVSAKSLAELAKNESALLGLNLRYHVTKRNSDKLVDSGMGETIRRHPDDFWFFNNGIVIVCRSYSIVGKTIRLRDFSVVNGGQTTHNIRDIAKTEGLAVDFPVMCKVVRSRGGSRKAKSEFCSAIAEYTNSQKPIKTADLKSNLPEQRRLDSGLRKHGVFYVRKAGVIAPPTYPAYMVATMERIGKMGLAGVMLMPGAARNKLPSMFEEDNYDSIFVKRVPPQFYADMLVVSKRYQQFKYLIANQRGRVGKGRWFDDLGVRVVNHAETFILSSIAFLAKIEKGAISIQKYKGARRRWRMDKDKDGLQKICVRTIEVDELFRRRDEEDEQRFHQLFRELCKTILRCWQKAQRETRATPDISAFLKRDDVFHDYITDVIYKQYRQPCSALRRAWNQGTN